MDFRLCIVDLRAAKISSVVMMVAYSSFKLANDIACTTSDVNFVPFIVTLSKQAVASEITVVSMPESPAFRAVASTELFVTKPVTTTLSILLSSTY